MEKRFLEYLKSVGITTEVLLKKIESLYDICVDCSEICLDEINDIFVDEYIKEDGEREYGDITFFSDRFHFTAINFCTQDEFVIVPIKKKVLSYKIKKFDYDFKKATEKSRLYLKILLDNRIEGEFRASKENCDCLKDLIIKYVKPNLKE